MLKVVLVGAGGFLGSVIRYLLGGFVHRLSGGHLFPLGTLSVNVLGCLCIGCLAGPLIQDIFLMKRRVFSFWLVSWEGSQRSLHSGTRR